eukprot:scaffold44043_cov36-Phaeocystis_antarctica.AAC.3
MVWAAVLEYRLVTGQKRLTPLEPPRSDPGPRRARACNFYLRDAFYHHGLRPASRHFSEPNRRRHEVDLAIGGRCGTAESWRVVRARRCAARPHRASSAIYVSYRAWCVCSNICLVALSCIDLKRPAAPYLAYGACVAATVRDTRPSMLLITLSYGAPKHLEAPYGALRR